MSTSASLAYMPAFIDMSAAMNVPLLGSVISAVGYVCSIPANFQIAYATDIVDAYPDYPVYIGLLYAFLVFYMPDYIMKYREPINPRRIMFFWNIIIAILSYLGARSMVPEMWSRVQERGFYNTTCVTNYDYSMDGQFGFYTVLFMVLKVPELLDTMFLVLQKRRVSFLQWYHHCSTALFVYWVSFSQIPAAYWFSTMNYSVHAFMYTYYALNSLGFRRFVRPFAPLITTCQVVQMFWGTAVVLFTTFMSYTSEGCDMDGPSMRMALVMYGSYCVLFCVLFKQLYIDPKPSKSSFVRNVKADD